MPILLMAAFAYCTVTTRIALVRQSSRGGDITAAPQDLAFVRALEQTIPAGDTLFVFPYMPVIYHFTRTQNPTRYCFLQPGMMTAADEQAALSDLRARPPHWVVYSDISPGAYLSIFPNSDPARLRMPRIEDFISHNYEAVAAHRHSRIIYQILRIREDASAAQPDSSRPVSSIPPRA
jgi:hypothetical protein